jgi:hypothetical protein
MGIPPYLFYSNLKVYHTFPKDAVKAEKRAVVPRVGCTECPNPWILFRFYAIIKNKSKERALSGIRENVTLQ